MNNFLRKLKLADSLTTELEITKQEFVTRLKENVDEGTTDAFSDMFDIFTSSKNEYKGRVGLDHFEIKRRAKFFDSSMNLAVAKGTYRQKDQILIIDTEINSFVSFMWLFLIGITFIYSIFFLTMLTSYIQDDESLLGFPFLIFHATFMYGIPYFIMRRSTSRLKYDLEREFHYLTKPSRNR